MNPMEKQHHANVRWLARIQEGSVLQQGQHHANVRWLARIQEEGSMAVHITTRTTPCKR